MLSSTIQKTIQHCFKNFKSQIPQFVSRKEQNYMVAQTAKILAGNFDKDRRIGVIEAGTGTGKSLAYCLGGIPLALSLGKKLCISTATVALQEQLLNKDLPLFQQHSRLDFKFGLIKGRQRYVCSSKLELAAQSVIDNEQGFWHQPPDKHMSSVIEQLWDGWSSKTWDGERDSWPTPISNALWQQIQCDKFGCNKQLHAHRQCPFHKARECVDKMDVLIVNHSLLLADLELGGGRILPDPEAMFYVIDEAHHLPHQAREFSSASSTIVSTLEWLSKIDLMAKKISATLSSDKLISPLLKLSDHANQLTSELQLIKQWLNNNPSLFANEDKRVRFAHGILPQSLSPLVENCEKVSKLAKNDLSKVHQIVMDAYKDGDISPWKIDTVLHDLGSNLARMENQHKLWFMLNKPDNNNVAPTVRWIEHTDIDKGEFVLHAAPIEVGFFLEDNLWSQALGVILCSATLTALNSFDSFRRSAGLQSNDGTQYIRLNSPFDFSANSELIIPKIPVEPSSDQFTDELINQLTKRLKHQGASLVLFSSYWQMNLVAKRLREKYHYSLLVQGEASRNALLTLHKNKCDNQLPSILFGTSSFSEGLDLPGHYLTNLIITKLPFAVPNSPTEEAHSEYIKSKNGNPFMVLTIPDASRKLIQSCGRLLRNERDSGTITILDRRLVTKRYGQSLIDSLPPYKLTIEH